MQYLFAILLAGALALMLSWMVWTLSMRFKLYPGIRERDIHSTPTPRLGGIAVFLAFAATLAVTSANPFFATVWGQPRPVIALIIAATIIVAVGAADDLFDLDWMIKLGAQFLAAGVITLGGGLQILALPFGGITIGSSWLSAAATMFVLVIVMNAVNFIDGLDGLVAGTCLIAGGVFFIYSYLVVRDTGATSNASLAALLAALVVGVCAGFLPLNWRGAKLFLGDSGALLLGLLLGSGTVAITQQITPAMLVSDNGLERSQLLGAFLPMVLLPVIIVIFPLADFTLAVARRMGQGRSPFAPDRKHLHHRLLDLGHTPTGATIVFYAWTGVLAMSMLLMYVWVRQDWPGGFWVGVAFAIVGAGACTVVTAVPARRGDRARPDRSRVHAHHAPDPETSEE